MFSAKRSPRASALTRVPESVALALGKGLGSKILLAAGGDIGARAIFPAGARRGASVSKAVPSKESLGGT